MKILENAYHSFDRGNFSLMIEIYFVSDQQDGHFIVALHSHNLFFHCLDVLKGLVIGQAVANDEPLPVLDVEVPHRGKLLCSGRVQDLEDAGRAVDLDLLPVKVFDGRIVLLHEVTRNELNRQSRFADTARPENDHFELAHFKIFFVF